ncbi:MAG: hypothetical protein AMQ22_01234 [Candidatus Methanofastidiosum methylothiophilum]|uniref:The GLUG motif protein n=1 Tax=Candidatus Methanofastidiosum methylothiophilum TaxID=1705564 RepID=A0A150J365_9EURY|nr:MAG: hypothetical protein AMQ22_01234 [Candidatus Methanofastidiosum methylthiophilus]
MTITGSGTSADPYIIYTLDDLALIGTSPYTLNKYFKLNNDIDASPTQDPSYNGGTGWNPIGNSTTKFSGNFNGNNKTISGLFINKPTTDNIGLFGYTTTGFSIYNLILEVDITGQNNVGGLLGYYDEVSNSDGDRVWGITVHGEVTGNNQVGGIVGVKAHYGYIDDCYSDAVVSGANQVGGIFGQLLNLGYRGIVKYCDFDGVVNISGSRGGLIGGEANQDVTYCNAYGELNASATSDYIGGIIGYDISEDISYCNCYSNITGRNYVGGIVGTKTKYNAISFCRAYGVITGNERVGGIAGHHGTRGYGSTLQDCYFRGEINATGNYVGGIAGSCSWLIQRCLVSSDTVINSPNSSYVGGIVGLGNHGPINNCINLIDINGIDYVGGIAGKKELYDSYVEVQNYGNITGRDYVGGITGYFSNYDYAQDHKQCINYGNITGRNYVGGIAGRCDCRNWECYNRGKVSGQNNVGGIFGHLYSKYISRAYNTGQVIGTGTGIGGLVGSISGSGGDTNSFWDVETSGIAISARGTGKTTAEMKTQSTYTGWDFTTPVWLINPIFNDGYPYLNIPKFIRVLSPNGITSTEGLGIPLIRITVIHIMANGVPSTLLFGIPKLSAILRIQGIDGTIQLGIFKTLMEVALKGKGIKLLDFGTLKTLMEVRVVDGGIPSSIELGIPMAMYQISPEGIDNSITMGTITLIWDEFIRPNGLDSFISFGELVTYIRYWKENIEFTLKGSKTNFDQVGGDIRFLIETPSTEFELKKPTTRFELIQPRAGTKLKSQTIFELRK